MARDRGGPLGMTWARIARHLGSLGTEHLQARRDMEDPDNHRHGFLNSYYDMRHRRLGQMAVDYGATTFQYTNMPAPTLTAATPSSVTNARGDWIQMATNTTSGDWAGMTTAAHFERRMEPAFAANVRTGGLPSLRYWIGLFDTNPQAIASSGAAAAGLHAIAFAYDDGVASGGNWQIITCDGTTQTTTDSGISIGSNSHYALEIECDDLATDEVRFIIDGATAATVTANLTADTTPLLWAATVTNLTTTSRFLRLGLTTMTKAG